MDKSTKDQYDHNLDILLKHYQRDYINFEEFKYCLHRLLEDFFESC